MPFYEYQCKNCGHELEAMQKVSDDPLKKCPHCGKAQLQRLISAPVFRLKGGGWYETDFKNDKDNKRNLADRPEADASKEPAAKAEKDLSPAPEPAPKQDHSKDSESPKKAAGKGDGQASAAARKRKTKVAGAAKTKVSKGRKR